MTINTATQDSDDLEALFDSIVAANAAENEPKASFEERPNTECLIHKKCG